MLLLLAGVFFVWLEWLEPHFFLLDDNALYHLPAYLHNSRAVMQDHQLAFVNLLQSRGVPHLGAGQTAALYPPVYIATLLSQAAGDVRWAMDLLVIAHLLAAACGMHVLLRGFGLRLGALVGALAVATSPFLVVGARSWVVLSYGAAFAMWGFVALLKYLDQPTWRNALLLGSVQLCFFLSGYPQLLLYAAIYQGLYLGLAWTYGCLTAAVDWRSLLRPAARLACVAGLTAAAAAPLLLPMLAVRAESASRSADLSTANILKHSVSPGSLLRAQFFSFDERVVYGASSSLFYVGVPILLGWGCVLFARKMRLEPSEGEAGGAYLSVAVRLRIFAALALLALVVSTRAYGLLIDVPILAWFRGPFKNLLFFLLFAVPPAAWSLEWLARRSRRAAMGMSLLVLAGPLVIAGVDKYRASIGFLTLQAPVETLRQEAFGHDLDPNFRLASFRPFDRPTDPALLHHLVVYNLATLYGDRVHFGGYEPLVSKRAFSTAFRSRHGVLPVTEIHTTAPALRHLGNWGVAYLLAPRAADVRRLLSRSGVAKLLPEMGPVDVYEIQSPRPVVENLHDGSALPHQLRTNGLSFRVSGDRKVVRLALEPLEGWTWRLDGEPMGRPPESPGGGMALPIPAGSHDIQVDYRPPWFSAGIAAASASAVAVLVVLFLARSTSRSNRSQSGVPATQ